MGYLVCTECNGYYKLQPGEKPEDYSDKCSCGGKLEYRENIEHFDSVDIDTNSNTPNRANTLNTSNTPNTPTPTPTHNTSTNLRNHTLLKAINLKKDLIVSIISVAAINILLPSIGLLSFLLVGLSAGFFLSQWLKLDEASSIINLTVMAVIFTLGYAIVGIILYHSMLAVLLQIYLVFGIVFFILSFIGLAANKTINGKKVV